MRDSYFNCHAHTMYSNLRLLDCINRPKDLIDTSIELGLSGVAITDHECLSAHAEVNQYAKEIYKEHPDFKIVLGNEIYLIDKRGPKQKYYHFILLAKDKIGYTALKKMSTMAWDNIYTERGLERVPLEKTELKSIMEDFKGHVIATTACRGGEMSTLAFQKYLLEKDGLQTNQINQKMYEFFLFCKDIFGDDFYLEIAPSTDKEQIAINQMLLRFAKAVNMKVTVGNDAHYLLKKDRSIHKAYLNSKNGDREVDSFYAFTYLMDIKEIYTLLSYSFSEEVIDWIIDNSLEIQNKIQNFDLSHKQIIPKVPVHNYPPIEKIEVEDYPTLFKLFKSSNIQERCWVNDCFLGLKEKKKEKNSKYLQRLEIEADIIDYLGKQLEDCLFAYFNTFKHYIDLFWECGSIVGPGRGSSTGFLSNYLLGITQLDPIRWNIKYWRFLNKERAELPDIDIDLAPSKRQKIFQAIRKERGKYGLVQVATFGTEGTRSSILAACRGYRSEDYPDGIGPDDAQYLSSFIPSERGFLWSIQDVLYGNEEKGRKPVQGFVREIQKYPGLIDIITAIDSLVNKRSVHASGVILYGEDPFATASFMKTGSGDLITCWDLHRSEAAGK